MEFAGLPYSTKMPEVTEIEICLEDLQTMKPVKFFINLKILSINKTQIESIEGLHLLKNLEELYLSENYIQSTEGLEGLSSLRRLNLSCNKIKAIENLQTLISLEWFWINENQIIIIENFETLQRLKELSLARNQIQTINSNLILLRSLEVLNLSGNPICSFGEIFKLSRMEKLTNLSLADPNYGDSTICSLSNYSIFVLYYLRQLTILDANYVSAESRALAETTFVKKKLYYTMRIKTLKRSIANMVRQVTNEAMNSSKGSWDYILRLLKATKEIEREIDENTHKSEENEAWVFGDEKVLENPLRKYEKNQLNALLDENHALLIGKIKEEYQKVCGYNRIFMCILNKIEDWGKSIFKELENEFSAGGNLRFEEGTPSDSWYKSCCDLITSRQGDTMSVCPTRVVRIHNRLLRNRFEEKLESLVDISENYYKRNIDYLFYSGDDLDQIISEGFKSPTEYTSMGHPCCIPLSYSLGTSEISRVRKMCEEYDDVHEIFWPKGRVLLCKVYFGKGKGDLRVPYYQENMTPREVWDLCPFNPPNICWAVYRTFEYDIKQRVWFLFDNTLILPEYYIEFEYSADGFAQSSIAFESSLESLSKPISAFLSEQLFPDVFSIENLSPEVPKRYMTMMLEDSNLKNFCRGSKNDYLNLLDCNLQKINLSSFSKISVLILSGNLLMTLEGLSCLEELVKLDASFNLITSLDGISQIPTLAELDLHNNMIFSLGEIRKIPKSVVKLTCFHNDIYLDYKYDEVILGLLPNLTVLDWRNITKILRKKVLYEITASLASTFVYYPAINPAIANFFLKLETLELENAYLLTMKGLENCRSLKKLNLSNNFISEISHLSNCEVLEELNLSSNFIEIICNLNTNLTIRSLDLSYNRICKFSSLTHLSILTRLCLESNLLTNIGDIKDIQSLQELYISNNNISDTKEIISLKKIPNLMILDIFGNPLAESARNRYFILYHFNGLKVLNGINVENVELIQAKQDFGGVLSEELLEKRSAGLRTIELRQLDLSNSKLRSLENMFTNEQFPKLLELSLKSNLFTNFSMFSFMPMLAKLDLSNNKIDSFLSGNKALISLPNLEILNISNNIFTNFAGLQFANLRNLRILNASQNIIAKTDFIECLCSIRELDLSFNKIRSFDRKLELPNIRMVNFDGNGLKNLNFLENLIWLQAIKASGNRISEMIDIDKVHSLPSLLELMLAGNPLERKAGYRVGIIRKSPGLLFLDGKAVTEDERNDFMESKKPPSVSRTSKLVTKIASITLDAYFLKVHPRTAGNSVTRKN